MIYLDHNATTPLDPRVLESMLPFLQDRFGNASGYYRIGRDARQALEQARADIAACVGARPGEILFTSGGTESDNLAIRGVVAGRTGAHIITSAVEHPAVLNTCRCLEQEGCPLTVLPVDGAGQVDPREVRACITPQTVLISIMHANNETGVLQPIEEIGAVAREHNVAFHTDAVQTAGKVGLDVGRINCDLMSLSAHKFYGPKGIGALFVRSGTMLRPRQTGGHHEHGLRAGTENVAGAVGMACAMQVAEANRHEEAVRVGALRDRFEAGVSESVGAVLVNGVGAQRVPTTSNISILQVDGESVLLHLDLRGICASSGSACTTGMPEPSHVLRAMGRSDHEAQAAVRFSFGRGNTPDEIEQTIAALRDIVVQLRRISSIQEA